MDVHITITLLLCLLNIIPFRSSFRKTWILPLSFLTIGLFMGLRYDYGLDYWNYYSAFYSQKNHDEEFLFWEFFFSFDKYYKYILVKSLLLSAILFYLVRKYVPIKYYWLFIFLFMTHESLFFTLMAAERASVGAIVFWIGLDLFYFRKKRFFLLTMTTIIASLFHTVLLSMLIVPIADFLFNKIIYKRLNINILMAILGGALIAGMIITSSFFSNIILNIDAFSKYEVYSDTNRFGVSNFNGTLLKALMLFPIYFITTIIDNTKNDDVYLKFVVLSLCYIIVYYLGLEADGRIGMLLLPFFIIVLTQRMAKTTDILYRWIMVIPFLLITLYGDYVMYTRMINEPWLEGNYLTYQTIFDVAFFE